ncbi:MAG: sugar phosphate isomerase/epimerase family protein [Christensenellales bacterium]
MKRVPVAYQLYSARDSVARDLPGVLRQLKQLGYDGVEFAGFFDYSAKDLRDMLDKEGLVPISSHCPLTLMQQDMFGTIAYHQALGVKYIAIPYVDEEYRPGNPGFAELIKFVYTFGALCRKAGLQLLYHNHDFEFAPVSGGYGLDFLYASTPAKYLATQIDTCWVKYAGEDPAAYIRKYTSRAPVVHLKDYVGTKGEGSPYALIGKKEEKALDTQQFEFRAFGHGCQDAKAIVEAGIDAGAEWFVVEQDLSYHRTPLEDAALSLDTLRQIGLK